MTPKSDAIRMYYLLSKVLIGMNMPKPTELNKEIKLTHLHVMMLLNELGSCNLTLLSRKVEVSNQVMTGISSKLVHLGLVERIKNQQNRREIAIQLTTEGKCFIQDYLDISFKHFSAHLTKISQEDIGKLYNATLEILEVLERSDYHFGQEYLDELNQIRLRNAK